MNRMLRLDEDRVFLCARKNCCPSVSLDKDDPNKVIIKDDYGNSIEIDKDQAMLIGSGISILEKADSDGRKLLQE